jgi:LuxR family transcriptional regulator, maltose regulon positive regulatory protein
VGDRAVRHGDRAPQLAAGTLLARLAAIEGDLEGAFALLDQTGRAWPGWDPPAALQAMISEEEARLFLQAGDLTAARAALAALRALPGDAEGVALATQMTQARLLRGEGRHASAADVFRSSADAACAGGQQLRRVEALVGACGASRAAGEADAALVLLGQALALAQDESIVAPFVSEVAAVRPLLVDLEHRRSDYAGRGFRQRLLETIGLPAGGSSDGGGASSGDALSHRELTVLRFLQGNLNNTEIAAAMTVSPNTLKTHIRNVYRKLGVKNRQEAIALGRGPR